jgi:predicted transposase YdaD
MIKVKENISLEFVEMIFRLYDPKINKELREVYNMKTVSLRDLSNQLSKEEGMLIGEEKGKEEGILIGKEKGKEEGEIKKAFDVARSMLADGLPAKTIMKYTGLDENSILSLR